MKRIVLMSVFLVFISVAANFSQETDNIEWMRFNGGMEYPKLLEIFGHQEFEIIIMAGVSNRAYYNTFGERKPGSTIGFSLTVAPIGEKHHAQSKRFAGADPIPVMYIYKDGKPGEELLQKIKVIGSNC
jgi:hypothetical protein